jgi:hypothetical protein
MPALAQRSVGQPDGKNDEQNANRNAQHADKGARRTMHHI